MYGYYDEFVAQQDPLASFDRTRPSVADVAALRKAKATKQWIPPPGELRADGSVQPYKPAVFKDVKAKWFLHANRQRSEAGPEWTRYEDFRKGDFPKGLKYRDQRRDWGLLRQQAAARAAQRQQATVQQQQVAQEATVTRAPQAYAGYAPATYTAPAGYEAYQDYGYGQAYGYGGYYGGYGNGYGGYGGYGGEYYGGTVTAAPAIAWR
eukprot:NODE_987_length_1074_cov_5.559662_g943_i0.p1 GENE.NODE_987_length_1074_cov_5.559662_g943_i0~~NODE_987_length_1074_cov_5.559662_g943_i0.p1  ORF type:complete len:208 (-),score=38.69 NODE_987_length_1074_cov_5.559662_g943_i0:392-1015(-)